ncbi:hypothetical protein JJC00_08335 [Bradyrhizobium diazoefficiens]|uniref:hypothetical protein n=1 Tax=Bradyrhizobium diazoefficiens TaxID=1355477 RepID=UPI001909FD46|nr:hypothetical protein [Bradyrhizobium diazoefficiens]QQO35592.1 hypothetical protein JJC00_08335 [Bradyrhizobium diazoefficiens]
MLFKSYIRGCAVLRNVIDGFLKGPAWAKFDPELGYLQANFVRQDGIDGAASVYTFRPHGARTSFLYANRKPRINSYGNSFTEGEQVSDGETWQEYLAAHIGEPIGNYGIGSYGVYQAYRRLVRQERTEHGAEYLIFYVWGDDPTRSLMRMQHCAFYAWFRAKGGRAENFHGNPWAHIEMNLNTGLFVERENPLTTRESLYKVTDPDWMESHLKDDLALQLMTYSEGLIDDLDRNAIDKLAKILDFPFDWNADPSGGMLENPIAITRRVAPRTAMQAQAAALLNRYSQRANIYTLEKLRSFAKRDGKKILFVLFDPYGAMQEMNKNLPRRDQETVDYLKVTEQQYIDINQVHLRDFAKYRLSWEDYQKEYLIGHYNPHGNHFFAFAIKDKVVQWLDPKPTNYSRPDASRVDFEGYLQGY